MPAIALDSVGDHGDLPVSAIAAATKNGIAPRTESSGGQPALITFFIPANSGGSIAEISSLTDGAPMSALTTAPAIPNSAIGMSPMAASRNESTLGSDAMNTPDATNATSVMTIAGAAR